MNLEEICNTLSNDNFTDKVVFDLRIEYSYTILSFQFIFVFSGVKFAFDRSKKVQLFAFPISWKVVKMRSNLYRP
jgi:hypothetical protein